MKQIKFIIFFLIIVLTFFYFLRIGVWDPDFWWHIATGRDIVNTGSLPDKDIFSYPSGMEENRNHHPVRENFILKQYWLSQIIFYVLFDYFGPGGVIVLRSLIFSLIIFIVLLRLHRWSVSAVVSSISGFALLMMFSGRVTGDRPVLFTLLFTAITFFILEDFRNKKDKRIFLLLPLMLLWSNIHGGFIIGVIIIAVFMLGELLKMKMKKVEYTRRQIFIFYSAAFLSMGISFLNPTGWDAFNIAFSSKYTSFVQGVQEYDSPFFVFYKERLSSVDYWYLVSAALFPLVLTLRNRKFDITHAILLSGFFMASISALRFIVYFEIIAVMVIGKEFDFWLKDVFTKRFSEEKYLKLMKWLTIAALFSLLIAAVSFYKGKDQKIMASRFYFYVPEAAVNFVEANRLKGNMFNDYGYGGYLAWRLFPWKKTFIDTRALNLATMSEYSWIATAVDSIYNTEPSPRKGPLWQRLLKHYDINFIFLNFHDVHGSVLPLIFKVSGGDEWVPVFCDSTCIIFIRNISQNKDIIEKFQLSEDYVYDALIYRTAGLALSNQVNPRALISLGETFYQMGRLKDSLTAYNYAMKRLPSSAIQERIKKIEAELKKGAR